MNLQEILDNVSEQLRVSPISTSANIVQWLTQSIKHICTSSKFLEKFTIIPAKSGVSRYFLPGDHIATIGVLYDGSSIGKINAGDSEFVSPSTPTYYYEDEWEDEASTASISEFSTHYALNELWPLQLMRSQPSAGSKTLTLLSAPTADGTAASTPLVGVLDGTVDSTDMIWSDTTGAVVSVLSSDGNLLLFYKYVDVLPVDALDTVEWNDLLSIVYSTATLGLALSTEDDEYDRYRSWLYTYIADSVAMILRNMAVNRRLV